VAVGIGLIAIGAAGYILYGIFFNFYLRKNGPEALELDTTTVGQKRTIYVRHVKEGTVPAWVDILMLVAMPSFLLGVLLSLLSLALRLWR
jgi:hypothetical protein